MKSLVLLSTVTLAAVSPTWLPFGFDPASQIQPLTAPPAVQVTLLSETDQGNRP